MKVFTFILAFCFILYACSTTVSDSEKRSSKVTKSESTDALPFPDSWLGNWSGTLKIYKENKVVQSIPMELQMQAIDTSGNYIWAIIYGEDKKEGLRPYELEIVDREKGFFLLDEKNSIKIESYLFGSRLMSWYEVMGNQMISITEKTADKMTFEIIFGSTTAVSTTGGQTVNNEEIPLVNTFPITVYQCAELSRK